MTTLSRPAKLLTGAFVTSGIIHLVKPEVFMKLVPRAIPAKKAVYLSGVAELICAAGLSNPAWRRWAGPASAALLAGVLPGNVQMALDSRNHPSTAYKVATWLRVPLQLPLIRAAWRAGRSS